MLALTLFGHFCAVCADGATLTFATDKTRALCCYLALHADRPQRRDVLATLFWPDYGEEDARRNLRQTLYRLKQALAAAIPETVHRVLEITRDAVTLHTDPALQVDVHRFQTLLDGVQRHSHPALHLCSTCISQLATATALYQGELLPDLLMNDSAEFEQWLLQQRESLQRQVVRALLALIEARTQRGETATAIAAAERLLYIEPWNEEAHQHLMRLYLQQGERSSALAHFERYRRVLAAELDAPPSAAMTQLWRTATQSDAPTSPLTPPTPTPTLRADFRPSLPTLYSFPSQPTSFVGRTADLDRILDHWLDPDCRLLTIVGMGGVGKTRLAQHAAQELAKRPILAQQLAPDGIYFVFLADAINVDLTVTAIAASLQISLGGCESPLQQLCQALAHQRLLVVLDNVEQLLSAENASAFVNLLTTLLNAAPGLRLLATSREALQVRGEWRLPLEGLTFPGDEQAQDVERCTAVELFVQATRHIQPAFSLDATTKPLVAHICRLVQGVPLALEIAATWLRLMPCATIAAELERNLDFLEAPLRDLPERHRSMRAVFAHSWRLLLPAEQMALARLAVFVGGFDLDAARAVAGATPLLLASLVDKSLIQRSGEGRYQLHELVRQFAAEQLLQWPDSGFATSTRRAHSAYFLQLATFPADVEGVALFPAQRERIERTLDNVRSAWEFAAAHAEIDLLVGAVRGLAHYYQLRGLFQEGAERFARAAALLSNPHPQPERLQLLVLLRLAQARLLLEQGIYSSALALLQQTQPDAKRLDDATLLAEIMAEIGVACWRIGALDAGRRALEESLALATRAGARQVMAYVHHHLGNLLFVCGDHAVAQQYLRLAEATYRSSQNLQRLAGVLNDYALQLELPNQDTEQLLLQSIAAYRAVDDEPGLLIPLSNLGYQMARRGAFDLALQHLHNALETAQRLHHRTMLVHIQINLGHVNALLGDVAAAYAWYCDSAANHTLTADEVWLARIGAAYVCAIAGAFTSAAMLLPLDIIESRLRGAELEAAMLTQTQARLAEHLTPAAQSELQQRGDSLPLDVMLHTAITELGVAGVRI